MLRSVFLFELLNGCVGASRHALTVGFVATMVFAVGKPVLPAFAGNARALQSAIDAYEPAAERGLHVTREQ
jgi:hypothetical protein